MKLLFYIFFLCQQISKTKASSVLACLNLKEISAFDPQYLFKYTFSVAFLVFLGYFWQ